MHVFLSYSREDLHVVLTIETGLRAAGLSVWRDEPRLRGEQLFGAEVEQALQTCALVLVCLSPRSVASHRVRAEMRYARNKLLAVTIEAFENTADLEADLAGIRIRDLTAWMRADSAASWVYFLDDCYAMLGRTASVPARASPPKSPADRATMPATDVTGHNSSSVSTLVGAVQGDVSLS
jgi:hypothetical protein